MQQGKTIGRVYLVGAGPGDPGLVTLRGAECLGRADAVFYDYLVNPALLDHVRPGAKLVRLAASHGAEPRLNQHQINALLIEEALRGSQVVRLKGGDPDIFGRAAEEAEALRAAGIPCETVPGVTAALAAAAYTGIPITHGLHASAVALVTGHERSAKHEPALDYAALADFPGTLIFYMGITSAPVWAEALVARGKPADTPVAIVRRCTWPDQETIRTTLGHVAETVATRQIRPPAVIVVGSVVDLAPESNWFDMRPLRGRRVLVTRPERQASSLLKDLRELGAQVLVEPAIEILPPEDWTAVDAILDRLTHYHWLVFSSANGVRFLVERLWQRGGDLRALGALKLAAIGPGTAEELATYHLRTDLVPDEYRAESLAAALAPHVRDQRVLLARASRGREVLAEELGAAGATVDQVVVYQSRDVAKATPDVAQCLAEGRIDWITVTSSAIARSLVRLFGDDLRRARLASISPVTSDQLRQLGYLPSAEATQYTMSGLLAAILQATLAP